MSVIAPDRSHAQRLNALSIANDIRIRRAQLKRDVKAGRVSVVPFIADPPDWLLAMRVGDLLLSLPRFGSSRVGHALKVAGLSPAKTVGGLTERQRGELVRVLRTRRLGLADTPVVAYQFLGSDGGC